MSWRLAPAAQVVASTGTRKGREIPGLFVPGDPRS
jgi:hypothetical protein